MRVKQQGFILNETIICICCLMLMGVLTYAGSKTLDNYKAGRMITECEAIDAALLEYSRTHHAVLVPTVVLTDSKVKYEQAPLYPVDLNELTNLQTDTASIVRNIDFTKFTYTVQTDSTGKMKYHLGVTLPNGKAYTSRLSGY